MQARLTGLSFVAVPPPRAAYPTLLFNKCPLIVTEIVTDDTGISARSAA
jgi:hypothetical protein